MSTQVSLCRHTHTHNYAALKHILQESNNPQDSIALKTRLNEPDIIKLAATHTGIVTTLQQYSPASSSQQQQQEQVIVQEWLKGGHILDEIPYLSNTYSEAHASEICHQLNSAIAHLHNNNIIHRDIRPEHILFKHTIREQCGTTNTSIGTATNGKCTATATSQFIGISAAHLQQYGWEGVSGLEAMQVPPVAIIDLGMALVHNTSTSPPTHQYSIVGSPGFIAPEVILGSHPHSPAMDIFSLGVVMFILLVGRLPFNFKDTMDLGYATMELVGSDTGSTAPGLLDTRWDQLPMEAKHLLLGMLEYNPEKRLTAIGVMNHPWVVGRGLVAGGMQGGSSSVVPCKLGMHVAQGAATVAALRRLTGMDTGVMTEHDSRGNQRRKRYVGELKRVQKLKERISKASIMEKSAKKVAAQTYAKMHDSGGSVDPVKDISRPSAFPNVGASFLTSPTPPDSTTGKNINNNGLEKSDSSNVVLVVENGSKNGGSKSSIKMLTSSIKVALDASSSSSTGNNNSRDATGYGGNAGLSNRIKVDTAAAEAALLSTPTAPIIIIVSSEDKIVGGGLCDGINAVPASQYTVTPHQYAAMTRRQVVGVDDCRGSTSTKSSVSAADASDRPLYIIKRRGEGSYSSSREGSRSVGRRNIIIPSTGGAAAGEVGSIKSKVAIEGTATTIIARRATTPDGRKVVTVKPLE